MSTIEVVSLIVTFIGVASFAAVFTILYSSYATSSIKELNSGKRDIELIDEILYEKQEKVIRKRKVSRRIRSVFLTVLLILIIPLFLFSLINKFQGNVTMIANRSIMVVASGSMSEKNKANQYLVDNQLDNQFKTYDIIFLSKVMDESDLQIYDVIAYQNDQGINIIHRIISIEEKDGVVTYVTRGDANNANDTYQPSFADIIGKYTGTRVKTMGIFIMFLQSYPGIITLISLIYCLFMIDHVSAKVNKAQAQRIDVLSAAMGEDQMMASTTMKVEFIETIYYQNYAYIFNENGFVEKRELAEMVSHPEENLQNTMIQIINHKDTDVKQEKRIVLQEKEGVDHGE